MIDLCDINNGGLYADIVNAADVFRREHHTENDGAFVVIRPISFDKMKFCKENEFNFVPCGVGESICTAIKDAELNKSDSQIFANVEIVRVPYHKIDMFNDAVKSIHILMKPRRRWECEFAADWTFDDLNRMTADGMRHLP